jgi:hypothetical protein
MTSFTCHDPVRRRALAHRFAVLDPATTPADIAVAREAIEYVHDESLDDETRLLWSRWAYHTLLHLRGAQHPMLLEYSSVYETILRSQGLTFDAYRISTAHLDAVTHTGNRSMILNASLAVALALHDDGQCRAAAHTLDTPSTARNLSEHTDDDARAVIAVQAVIYAGCGLTDAALRLLHRRHHLLSRLNPLQVNKLADRLTGSEAEHPRMCELAVDHSTRPPRRQFWHDQITHALRPKTVQPDGTPPTTPLGSGQTSGPLTSRLPRAFLRGEQP